MTYVYFLGYPFTLQLDTFQGIDHDVAESYSSEILTCKSANLSIEKAIYFTRIKRIKLIKKFQITKRDMFFCHGLHDINVIYSQRSQPPIVDQTLSWASFPENSDRSI